MLRRYHRFFQSIQIIRDTILVGAVFWGAYCLRFAWPQQFPYTSVANAHETFVEGLMVSLLWPLSGWLCGLYRSRRSRTEISELVDVLRATSVAFLLLVTLTYFFRDVRYSRGILVLWAAATVVVLSTARILSKSALAYVRARGFNLRHVLVIGIGDLSEHVLHVVQQHSGLGLRVKGILGLPHETHWVGSQIANTPVLGTIEHLSDFIEQQQIEQVMIALPIEELGHLKGMMDVLSRETVDVRLIPDLYQYMTLCGGVDEFQGMPIINLQSTPLWGWNLILKRLFDIVFSFLGLVLLSPLFAAVAVAIRLSTQGPVFYRQERVGLDGSCFNMVKFRTMRVNAEQLGAQMTQADDPRRTRLGVCLRRWSVDELPQLWNVLLGHMSLVGPRPERPYFIETFKVDIPRYALRHKIKSGMTGWAQINGLRGNTSIRKRIELDLYYIENWSLLLDLKILFWTVMGGFLSPHAY